MKSEYQNMFWLNWGGNESNQWHACKKSCCWNNAQLWLTLRAGLLKQGLHAVHGGRANESPGMPQVWEKYGRIINATVKRTETHLELPMFIPQKISQGTSWKCTSFFHSRRKAVASCLKVHIEALSKQYRAF